jgi:hypothetical protein
VIQGNLDPAVLLASDQVIDTAAVQLLRDGLGGAHIFNLGHGVLPATPPGAVARLVDAVHRFSRAAALAEASTQDRSEERSSIRTEPRFTAGMSTSSAGNRLLPRSGRGRMGKTCTMRRWPRARTPPLVSQELAWLSCS